MKVLKWIGIGVAALLGLVVVLAVAFHFVGRSRMNNGPEIAVRPISIPAGEEAVARGERLVHSVSGCAGCHGENLGGAEFFEGMPFGYVPASNLTTGSYSQEDWIRAIQHGVAADGRTLTPFMPSRQFARMSDQDVAAVIAYLQTVPAADNGFGERELAFPGTIIFGLMGYGSMPVSVIDHDTVGGPAPEAGKTAEYGEYLTTIAVCADCHGEDLTGQTDPNGPQGPDLTTAGSLGGWTEADFLTLFREGVKPSGETVGEEMPWRFYSGMSDEELGAIWLHLQSLP